MAKTDTRAKARELVRQFAGEGGDMGTVEDALPPLAALLDEVAAPGFEVVMRSRPPAPSMTFPGVEGLAKAWGDYGEAFDEVRAILEEVLESDTHLVLLVDQRVTTHTGGVEMSQPSGMLFEFDDEGRIARAEFHLDREEALRVAGLDP